MAGFGIAGTVAFHRPSVSQVQVNLTAGEFLHYRIAVAGNNPIFNLTREGALLWSEQDFPGVVGPFQRKWPAISAELGSRGDRQKLAISFAGPPKTYDVVVELRDAAGASLMVLQDYNCTSPDPGDFFFQSIHVFYV